MATWVLVLVVLVNGDPHFVKAAPTPTEGHCRRAALELNELPAPVGVRYRATCQQGAPHA